MVPEDGCVIGEGDFSGAEIVTSCFPGYTLIETIAGPRSIKDVITDISNGSDVYVYGYNHENGRMGVAKVRGGKLSGVSKELWAVTLDNGERIEVTPDHKFLLRDGSELMVRDLMVGQSLMTHLKKHGITIEGYRSKYNHKIVSIEKCVRFDDVFNIEVEGIHNYALSAGIVVKNCTYHRDPTFINYQMDDNADMHKDAAARIWVAEGLVSKPVRQCIKSGFTFSQFYGSYYVSCALKMWEEMLDLELTNGVKLRDHISEIDLLDFTFSDGTKLVSKLERELSAKGMSINDLTLYEKFEKRVQAFEFQFWNEWFPVYTKWKKDIYEFYIKHGYIETFFGFRFRGYMDRKQASNYPVQGTSFHILLYSLIKLYAEIQKRGMKTKLVGQIHDSIVAQIPVDEIELYTEIFTGIVNNLQNELPWLCIPMRAEIEISKPREEGGSFAEMKVVAL